jgi:Tfp pilus assembly ATPase PilU
MIFEVVTETEFYNFNTVSSITPFENHKTCVIKQIEVNTDTIVIGSFVIEQVEVNTDIIVIININKS